MKKFILIIVVGSVVVLLDAQLRNRQRNPIWRPDELACCADRRSAIVPYSVASAEDAVDALREEIIDKYDKGVYMADKMEGWQSDRNKMLEIQSKLGFTPEEESNSLQLYEDETDSFDSGGGEDD